MTSFSQLVDKLVLETRRPDLVAEVTTYLNQTIRELHFDPKNGNAILYRDNLVELQLTASSETGFVWTIPSPQNFQAMLTVRYDNVYVDDEMAYSPEKTPGRHLRGLTLYHYRAGRDFAFYGYGGTDSTISLAYYEYPRALKYRVANAREATWDEDAGWSYHTVGLVDYDEDDDSRALAQSLCTNWILDRWETVVEEGLRAKVYKRLTETERARTCYSLYTTLRQGLFTSESSDLGGYS